MFEEQIRTLDKIAADLTDAELAQAVREVDIFDTDGGFDIDGILVRLCKQRYKSYYSRHMAITATCICKEAALRFAKLIGESDV